MSSFVFVMRDTRSFAWTVTNIKKLFLGHFMNNNNKIQTSKSYRINLDLSDLREKKTQRIKTRTTKISFRPFHHHRTRSLNWSLRSSSSSSSSLTLCFICILHFRCPANPRHKSSLFHFLFDNNINSIPKLKSNKVRRAIHCPVENWREN